MSCRCESAKEDGCQDPKWKIKAPKHGNCFWRYIKSLSNPDGSMREHTHAEIASLLSLSYAKTNVAIQEAVDQLREVLDDHMANEFLEESPESSAELPSIIVPREDSE